MLERWQRGDGTYERSDIEDIILDRLRAVDGELLGLDGLGALLLDSLTLQLVSESGIGAHFQTTNMTRSVPEGGEARWRGQGEEPYLGHDLDVLLLEK